MNTEVDTVYRVASAELVKNFKVVLWMSYVEEKRTY